MANLVNEDYFFGEIVIPNLNTEGNISSLEANIEIYQKEILMAEFGYVLYTAFMAGLAEDPVLEKWKDLRDGKSFEFELSGKTITRKWNGLINEEKISLISDYTYYKIKEKEASHSSQIGEVNPNSENSTRTNSSDKIANAWLRMREMYGITPRGFSKLNDAYYIHYNDLPSLYNFLLANETSYDDWEFEPKNSVNVFGY